MPKESEAKAFLIEAYYNDIEQRISFLKELHDGGHNNEALMLCCCYIEALGSQRYHDSERKAQNFCTILEEDSGNLIFGLIHPVLALKVLGSKKLFQENFSSIETALSSLGNTLCNKEKFYELIEPLTTARQHEWFTENIFKLTIAAISYDQVRSELVHDISTSTVNFNGTTFNGVQVPSLNFDILYRALQNIFSNAKYQSVNVNQWYWEQ